MLIDVSPSRRARQADLLDRVRELAGELLQVDRELVAHGVSDVLEHAARVIACARFCVACCADIASTVQVRFLAARRRVRARL